MTNGTAICEARMRNEPEAAFDHWLRRALSQQFGKPLAEPLPEELLRLLPQNDDQDEG